MAGVTVPYGFELPLGIENVSVPLLNRNFQKMNDALKGKLEIRQDSSSFDNNIWQLRNSRFTRISIGDVGIVIAKITIVIEQAQTLSTPEYIYILRDNRAEVLEHGRWAIPPGFGSKDGMYVSPVVASGVGINHSMQMGVSGKDIGLRRDSAGTPTATVVGSSINLNISYQWDGLET